MPSWAYANSGTGFNVFPRKPYGNDDAAVVHRLTGVAPTAALHIPWDAVDDYAQSRRHLLDHDDLTRLHHQVDVVEATHPDIAEDLVP